MYKEQPLGNPTSTEDRENETYYSARKRFLAEKMERLQQELRELAAAPEDIKKLTRKQGKLFDFYF
jgi:hypothetical protein